MFYIVSFMRFSVFKMRLKCQEVLQMIYIILLLNNELTIAKLLKFTNVKCQELATNNGLAKYEYCRLKVVGRNRVALSLRVSLLQLPLTNITTKIQFFQRSDGYRPFMYNEVFDFCKFLAAKTYQLSIQKVAFDAVRPYSNFNQTCPWKEDHMIVEKFALDFDNIYLPIPSGVYRVDFTFSMYGRARTLTQIFFEKN